MQNPLHVDFSGHTIYETPPNSQGSTLLVWLRLYEEYGQGNLRKFFRAGLESMEFRRSMIGDPEMFQLDQSYFSREMGRNKNTVSGISNYREKEDGDTTYFTVANSEGDIISMIQSNYMGFGSLVIPSGTGFIMQNRGSYFSGTSKENISYTCCMHWNERWPASLFSWDHGRGCAASDSCSLDKKYC